MKKLKLIWSNLKYDISNGFNIKIKIKNFIEHFGKKEGTCPVCGHSHWVKKSTPRWEFICCNGCSRDLFT